MVSGQLHQLMMSLMLQVDCKANLLQKGEHQFAFVLVLDKKVVISEFTSSGNSCCNQ